METMDYGDSAGLLAGMGAAFVFVYLLLIAFSIIVAWKINTKADKPGWACLIPIYSLIVQLEIIGKPAWWIIMLIIPGVNIVFAIMMVNLLSKSFGKDVGYTLGLIFLPIIFYPMLAFGSAEYQGPAGAPAPIAA
ncbi:DUF5684 domain-containing protein [Saccharicrinis aurantiacus]|uniref:DUF5684 domain-containing protein n=1 Tax=Saccharicrinis aurantiacus TaxID=1849719 RepID=UPI001C9E53BD|nr:DUF5684 domain-containing protein [Saccharicrinis aurantiacus]